MSYAVILNIHSPEKNVPLPTFVERFRTLKLETEITEWLYTTQRGEKRFYIIVNTALHF